MHGFLPAVLLGSVFSPAITAEEPASLILTNGILATVDPDRPRAEALAIRGDRIVAVGSSAEIAKLLGPDTQVIDLDGRFAMPGFIESHAHFVSLGESLMSLDLTKAKTWADIERQVSEAARIAPTGTWIVGRGWHQGKWEAVPEPNVEGYPTHHALSRATPDHPVILTHGSGHMGFANAAAMKLAGVTAATENPKGGTILKTPDGEPTGVFRETAQSLIRRAHERSRRSLSDEERRAETLRAVELATEACLKNGVTTFHDAGEGFANVDLFKQLAEEGQLKVRLWVMLNEGNAALREGLAKYRMVGVGDNHLTVRGIKRLIDGALGSHGAWMLEPYDDLPMSSGLNTTPVESIRETARLAAEHDYQFCTHAIGDRANRVVLDIFEETFQKLPSERSRRWRIEHAQHLHPDDIPRFGQLGVIASMQGVHATSDAPFVVARLGDRRAEQGAYVWQSLLKAGATICNGTDAPVEDIDPIACFHASVTRKLVSGPVFFREQCMTREQALRSYTIDAAFAGFEEDLKGSLTPGKLADVVVLSRDIMSVPEDQIRGTDVVYTIVGGRVRYQRER